jgi:uncharacterized protein (DUF2237 family)
LLISKKRLRYSDKHPIDLAAFARPRLPDGFGGLLRHRVVHFNRRLNSMGNPKNVLGTDLQACCFDPMTGYYRDGFCRTGSGDFGVHTVCAEMTEEFLTFSKSAGNDLSTPQPQFDFPGLKPGDMWCLCASRWQQAYDAGFAPPVYLKTTHLSSVEFAALEALREHAMDDFADEDDPWSSGS